MALLLNIDTATEIASVCVSEDARCMAYVENNRQKEHASFIQNSISSALNEARVKLKDIDAFAVTSGPGSYTGLRVGMATAKGFCYAFQKPLIAINTLQVMTKAAIDVEKGSSGVLFCPMIDARRMEAFIALYNAELETVLPPQVIILNQFFFDTYLQAHHIKFLGSGSTKFQRLMIHINGSFLNIHATAQHLASLAAQAFAANQFADVSYTEPSYCKDVYTPQPQKN